MITIEKYIRIPDDPPWVYCDVHVIMAPYARMMDYVRCDDHSKPIRQQMRDEGVLCPLKFSTPMR